MLLTVSSNANQERGDEMNAVIVLVCIIYATGIACGISFSIVTDPVGTWKDHIRCGLGWPLIVLDLLIHKY